MVGIETPWGGEERRHAASRVPRWAGGSIPVKDGELLFKSTVTAPWVRLSPEQILQHFTFKTAVADWLQTRTVWRVRDLGRNVPARVA